MNPVVVIGAGPYGLSAAAHIRGRGLPARVFGEPLSTWTGHMPTGMVLKSAPTASSISSPVPGHTLQDFCEEMGEQRLEAEHQVVPVDTFIRYGMWFQKRQVPDVEPNQVESVVRRDGRFSVTLDSGESITTGTVVVATGLPAFAYVAPELLGAAGAEGPRADGPVSHSSQHSDLSGFAGRDVLVVGAGQSALESSALLHEAGAQVRVLVRGPSVRYNGVPTTGRHWQPLTPLGRAWRLYPVSYYASGFRFLPQSTRLLLARKVLGPAGGWWLKERVEGRIPVATSTVVTAARVEDGRPVVATRTKEGTASELTADHVLAATGYRADVDRLAFLSPDLRAQLSRAGGFPKLRAGFESSVSGLFFTGFPAAATFGPLMRFVCGSAFASRHLAAAVSAAGG